MTATYSSLTAGARRSIALGAAEAAHTGRDEQAARELLTAHRDLTAALAHLGQTIIQPPGTRPLRPVTGPATAQPTTIQAAARTVQQLAATGQARDWTAPQSSVPAALACSQAARQLRIAADLLATHRDSQGRERSPEAVRLRHPAVLGAALREWNDLVDQTGKAATLVNQRAAEAALDPQEVGPTNSFPEPVRVANPIPEPLDLGVARPRIRTSEGPLVELADRVNYLRHAAWEQSQTDKPSAQILRNLAAIGATLNTAAAHTNRAAATLTQPGPDREAHHQTADQAMRAGDAWRSIGESIAYLRTPTQSMPAIELERMRINNLIRTVTTDTPSTLAAPALTQIAAGFDQVADWNAQTLRAAHNRGDLHMAGAGIPNQHASACPEAATAKIHNDLVHVPTLVMKRIERAYTAVTTAREITRTPAMEPPSR